MALLRISRLAPIEGAEVGFYREATERLVAAGFPLLRLDVNCRPPEHSAALIAERLTTLLAMRQM